MQLQKELLTPRYEVHQFSFEQVVLDDFEGVAATRTDRRERAAQVLLAAAGAVSDRDVRAEYGRELLNTKRAEYAMRYWQRVAERAQLLVPALTKYYEDNPPVEGRLRARRAGVRRERRASRLAHRPVGQHARR